MHIFYFIHCRRSQYLFKVSTRLKNFHVVFASCREWKGSLRYILLRMKYKRRQMGTRVGQRGGMVWHPALYCLICTYWKKVPLSSISETNAPLVLSVSSTNLLPFPPSYINVFLKTLLIQERNSLKEFKKFSINNVLKTRYPKRWVFCNGE